jgi:hypothetical protein
MLLPAAAQEAVRAALSVPVATGPKLLSLENSAPIIAQSPRGFHESCGSIVNNWPRAQGTAQWTLRLLFSTRDEHGIEAVLAVRCGSSRADMKEWYDERPAVLLLTHESAYLRLVPLDQECHDCERFYHVNFSKTFATVGTQLVELQASYSDDNPCCDGTDHKDGNRLVVVSLPAGEQVLSLLQYSEENSVDDEAGTDTVWVCQATVEYDSEAVNHVGMIRAETHCTVDDKPQPEVKTQSFRWNAEARRFEEMKPVPH